jgi:hypothetical protein
MENNIAFNIKGIEIIHSSITAPPEGGKVSKFNFDLQFRAVAAPKENLVTVFSDVVIKDVEQNLQIGQYAALFHYSVDDLEKWMAGHPTEIPQPLLTTLLGISVSTLRGMMFGAYRGTFLHAAVLPVVDIGALQEDNKDAL